MSRLAIDHASLDVLVGLNVDTSLEDARATADAIQFPSWVEAPQHREPELGADDDPTYYLAWDLKVVAPATAADARAFERALRRLPHVDFVELSDGAFEGYYGRFRQGQKPLLGQRYAPPQPGRNDPCPCGSDKKFKRCHGA